jgi:pimeloyl-ACP methyl ester carboxylesterase
MYSRAAVGVVTMALVLAACASRAPTSTTARPAPVAAPRDAGAPPMARDALHGTLVTFIGAREIARQEYRDDGATLTSELTAGSHRVAIELTRDPRRVVLRGGERPVEHDLAAGTVALENLDWQAYALVAEQFADATSPTPVQVYIPSRGATVPAAVTVRPGAAGGRVVELALGPLRVTVDVSAAGQVTHASAPAQDLEAREAAAGPPVVVARAVPDGVTEEPFEVTRGGVALRGTLWRPTAATGPTPVVVIIAGSGPTDRDCNSVLGLRTDAYRLLAEGLARRGVASVRYDKRGVGASGSNFAADAVTLTDFVDDAAAVLAQVRADRRFSAVTLAGHSEGGLVAMLVAAHARIDGLVLVATAGRTFQALIREQMARHLDAAPLVELDRVMAAVAAGRDPAPIPAPLAALFAPGVRPFLRSILALDPLPLLRALTVPTTVVQGETDLQVTVADARALAGARRGVRLTLLPETNHPLKREVHATAPQASYSDPSLPLAPGVVDAVLAGVATAGRPAR